MIRVRHKTFGDTGTARPFGKHNSYVLVRWDDPRTHLNYHVGVWNLVFRVPCNTRKI